MADLTVQCRDELVDEWLGELKLQVQHDSPTVRELIVHRVEQETGRHNAELDRGRQFRGLVTAAPSVTSELNGWQGRKREGKPVDTDVMTKIALDAYERGDLVLLIDGEQAGEIDSQVTLADGCLVVFRKLVPLVVKQTNPGRKRTKYEIEEA
ncbi:MAG TPA: hypothetical protein VGO80_06000 [Solirubrobacteraceae bacterium]|jgi:hypothetical protein|nr:hypothetical protein [Solirubrobacteraceae bacterium]